MSLLLESPFPEAVLGIIAASLAAIVWALSRCACCGEEDKDYESESDYDDEPCSIRPSGRHLSRDANLCPSRPEANTRDLRRRSYGTSSSADASGPRRCSSDASSSTQSEADAIVICRRYSGASSTSVRHSVRPAADPGSRASYGFQSEGTPPHERCMDQIELSWIPSSQSGSFPALHIIISMEPRADEFCSIAQRNERFFALPAAPAPSPRPNQKPRKTQGTPPARRDSRRQLPPVTKGRQGRNGEGNKASRGLRPSTATVAELKMSDLGLPGHAPASTMGLAPQLDAGTRRRSIPQKTHLSSGSLFYTNVIRKQMMRDEEERKNTAMI